MNKAILYILYFLNGSICLIFLNQSAFWPGFVSKAFIVPILMIHIFISNKNSKDRLHILLFSALFFSWAGDLLLEFATKYSNLFLAGLICFLFTHLLYLVVFFLTPGKKYLNGRRFYLLIPVIIFGIILLSVLDKNLGVLRLPVFLYTFVALAMLAGAINMKEKVNKMSYIMVLAGAILFVISDSVIAINKFGYNIESSVTIIMTTYILAQYLLVAGYVNQHRGEETAQISR